MKGVSHNHVRKFFWFEIALVHELGLTILYLFPLGDFPRQESVFILKGFNGNDG